jgi:L-ascorbate metabolism protein UlaG (beta-lactamase superfamily)
VTDPYDTSMVGLKYPKVEADIVTISHNHSDHNKKENIAGNPKLVSGPGEYEIKGVSIFGTRSFHDKKQGAERGENTIYTIVMDGITLCHLGDLGHKISEEQEEAIGNVDILFVPTGGFYTIGPEEATEIVSIIDPKVVIPMHYKVLGMTQIFDNLLEVVEFEKSVGLEALKMEKYVVSLKDKLPEERTLIELGLKN